MFTKKFISLLAAAVLTLCAGYIGAKITPASADGVDAADACFLDFISEDVGSQSLTYTYSPLYNANLQPTGRQYVFTVGNVQGYALIAQITAQNASYYEVEELFYGKQSPFVNCQGLPVYVSHRIYIDCVDGAFYNLKNGEQLSQTAVNELAYQGFGYMGAVNFVPSSETIYYSTKNTDSYAIQYNLPNYFGSVNGVTGCANTAGTVLIAYYDRFFEELIPNYQVYFMYNNVYVVYYSSSPETRNVTLTLYDYMETDVGGAGTTYTGFQDGMERYVEEKGRTYSTTNMFTSGSFDLSKYQNAVQQGKPVALFLTEFSMWNGATSGDGYETVSTSHTESAHIMIGCGYKIDTYYNSSGSVVATRKYLKVASGISTYGVGYMNLSGDCQINKAISVNIY